MIDRSDIEQRIISFRRSLHMIPELDFDLPKTRNFLLNVLDPLGFEIRDLGEAGFSVFVDAGQDETIAFRSDMDALPVEEPEGCPFRSIHEGQMHACGHDGHMSMLLGLAMMASASQEKMKKNCLLLFQAAEETNGGAELLCKSGILNDYDVKNIYGIHLWPGGTENTVSCRPREFMAGMSVLEIKIRGKQAHIANYTKGIDALEAGCTFVSKAYELEKTLPPEIFRLLRFGQFSSGTANNVLSGYTSLIGTVRTYDSGTFAFLIDGLNTIKTTIEEETGAIITIEYTEGYPPVINPPDLYEQTRDTLTKAGFSWREQKKPSLHAEDFAFYQQELSGLYMYLAMGEGARLHSPEYEMNESVLITGTELMWTLLTNSN